MVVRNSVGIGCYVGGVIKMSEESNEQKKTKRCTSVYHQGDREVPIEMFAKHKQTADRLQAQCKACAAIAQRVWYQKHPGAGLAATRKYIEGHRQKVRDYQKKKREEYKAKKSHKEIVEESAS